MPLDRFDTLQLNTAMVLSLQLQMINITRYIYAVENKYQQSSSINCLTEPINSIRDQGTGSKLAKAEGHCMSHCFTQIMIAEITKDNW